MFIKDMLKEELQNSWQIKNDYEEAIRDLPRGALVCKQIGGHPYYYLAHREGKRVVFDYLGTLSDEEIQKYEDAKQSRARYRKRLSEVNKQIRFLQKVIREKQPV